MLSLLHLTPLSSVPMFCTIVVSKTLVSMCDPTCIDIHVYIFCVIMCSVQFQEQGLVYTKKFLKILKRAKLPFSSVYMKTQTAFYKCLHVNVRVFCACMNSIKWGWFIGVFTGVSLHVHVC